MQSSVFCTVLSSKRLIQGIACIFSLYDNTDDFKLYILCVDEKCYDFMKKISFDKVILVNINEINREDFEKLKNTRKLNQYCWTLKPGFIKYVMNSNDDIERVTYIDSDLFFLHNPNIIFENQPDVSVLLSDGKIFLPMYSKEFIHDIQDKTGNYNSGFISFKNDVNAFKCVELWDKMCIESCTATPEDNKFGDQKYLDDMPQIFSNIGEITTPGVNIGHWNYPRYRFIIAGDNILVNNYELICYHFSGFRIVSKYDIRQIHEQDRINQPFIYDVYKKILRDIIDEVEKIDPDFKEYMITNEINSN